MKIVKVMLIVVAVLIVAAIAFINYILPSGTSVADVFSNKNKDILFSETDVHPNINAKINETFRINLGQVAEFKEGFKVMLVGYEHGCEGTLDNEKKNLIIKRAEASICATSAHAIYSVIKDGVAYVGQHETYINGYQIATSSESYLKNGYEDIQVILLDKSKVESLLIEEKNHQLQLQGQQELSPALCLQITDKEQKRVCTDFVARGTYTSEGFYPANANEKIIKARDICKPVGYDKGFCLIVGKEKVATPEMCTAWKQGEWRGSIFYEDCAIVSSHIYKTQ